MSADAQARCHVAQPTSSQQQQQLIPTRSSGSSMTTPTTALAHFLSAEAQARCHMASEKMVAVKSEAGITKMEEYPILLVPVRQMPSGFSARMRSDVGG